MLLSGARRLGLTATNSWRDLGYVLGFFGCYFVADLSTRQLGDLDRVDADGPSLLLAALTANIVGGAALALLIAALIWRSHRRLACRWSQLGKGWALRLLAMPALILLTWQGSLYDYNYLLDRAHLFDRVLLVALGLAVLARPVALIPFVIQSRVIAAQFEFPFGTLAAQNIDELLVVSLLALAAAHIMFVITAQRDSSPVVLVIAAALATHFFIPGRGKLLLNWIVHEDLANLPGSGYTVGWLGQTDGRFALWLAGAAGVLNWPMRIITLVVELGAALAAAHHRLLRIWLPLVVGFHIVNFLFLGFWFLGWIALEVVLFVLLGRRDLTEWFDRNLSLARAGLTVVVVGLLGAILFHPPGLAWYDTPLAYGYEIEVVGESGTGYNLPIEAFAPFSQELAFSRLSVGETRPLTGAYGVVVTVDEVNRLAGLTAVEQAAPLEVPVDEGDRQAEQRTQQFLADFLAYADRRADGDLRAAEVFGLLAPLPKYWTGRPGPIYQFQEPIASIEVFRTTNLRVDDRFERRRTSVLTLDS